MCRLALLAALHGVSASEGSNGSIWTISYNWAQPNNCTLVVDGPDHCVTSSNFPGPYQIRGQQASCSIEANQQVFAWFASWDVDYSDSMTVNGRNYFTTPSTTSAPSTANGVYRDFFIPTSTIEWASSGQAPESFPPQGWKLCGQALVGRPGEACRSLLDGNACIQGDRCIPCGGEDWYCCDPSADNKAEDVCSQVEYFSPSSESQCARLSQARCALDTEATMLSVFKPVVGTLDWIWSSDFVKGLMAPPLPEAYSRTFVLRSRPFVVTNATRISVMTYTDGGYGGSDKPTCQEPLQEQDADVSALPPSVYGFHGIAIREVSSDKWVLSERPSSLGSTSLRFAPENLSHLVGKEVTLDIIDACTSDSIRAFLPWQNFLNDAGDCAQETWDGDVRLTGSESNNSGRLEIYHAGRWGTVCGDDFVKSEAATVNAFANIACGQLGFSGHRINYANYSFKSGGSGQIWMGIPVCGPRDALVHHCRKSMDVWGAQRCSHADDIYLTCKPRTWRPPEHVVWEVTKGPCEMNGACITSPNFPYPYGPSESCEIAILHSDGLNITCENLQTGSDVDRLTIDDRLSLSGHGCPGWGSTTVTKAISWTSASDSYGNLDDYGWRLCSRVEVDVIGVSSSGSTFTFDPLQWSRMVGADDWRSSGGAYVVTQSRNGAPEWTGEVSVRQTGQGRGLANSDRAADGRRSEGPSRGQWQRGDLITLNHSACPCRFPFEAEGSWHSGCVEEHVPHWTPDYSSQLYCMTKSSEKILCRAYPSCPVEPTTTTTSTTTTSHWFSMCSNNSECHIFGSGDNHYCALEFWSIPDCFTEQEFMAINLSRSHGCPDLAEPSTIAFIQKHIVPLMSIAAVFLLVFLLHLVQVLWRRAQKRRLQRMEAITTAHSFGVAVGRRFVPSQSVNTHQFRGMRPVGSSVSIRFEELGLRLKDDRSVLEGVTGEFQSCHLVAIMGPSGAGKTTFMNVLAGRATYGKMTGKVFFNDAEVNPTSLRPTFGFVPQDDIVHPRLTVRENLHFAAQLRNPSGTPPAAIDDIVDDALKVLQISHIQSSLVGSVEERGISGGQRKRVSIGLELVACPALVYLDEPTSGLDSTTSLQILNSLRKMAELDMTIIMVIHQPRYQLFTLFDDVLLLGPGGRTVFLGPSQRAKPYFEELGFEMPECENPADWFMDVLSGGEAHPSIEHFHPTMLFDMWRERVGSIPPGAIRRQVTSKENYMIVESALKEEWAKVDVDQSGYLDKSELVLLLERCGVTSPDDKGVDDLMGHISTDRKRVLFQDLVGYVVGMASSIAVDKDISDRTATASRSPKSAGTQAERQDGVDDALLPWPAGGAYDTGVGSAKPGACRQFLTLVVRRLVQWFRESRQRLTDLGLISGCAVVVGLLHRGVHTNSVELAVKIGTFHMGLALLISVSCLKVFGDDRAMFWRESGGGMNVFSYMLAKMIGNVPDLLLQCTLYTSIYFVVSMPWSTSYPCYWTPCALLTLAAAGWGYFLSSVLPPQNAMTAVVIVVLVFCGVLGNPSKIPDRLQGGVMEVVLLFSMSRWSAPMTFVAEMKDALWDDRCILDLLERQMDGYGNATMKIFHGYDCSWDPESEWDAYHHADCVHGDVELNGRYALLLMAFVLHVGCYLGLYCTNRDKQV